jgi:site-specific DNA-methyltransferase (adenine-specific)
VYRQSGGVWRGRSARAIPDDDRRAFGQHYERTEKGRPVTAEALAWDGWGTALKPAHEPIALARKAFRGTVAASALAHGTGAINIDACRVPAEKSTGWGGKAAGGNTWSPDNCGLAKDGAPTLADGRWPANVLTDGSLEVLEAFPASAREAIRFFYAPKADRAEREFGMEGAREIAGEVIKGRKSGSAGTRTAHSGVNNTPRANIHPTVKPVDLMAWLIRLVTPPGGLVLEPFMGSGSTGIAAVRHGFRLIGIEQSPEYFAIARARITAAVAEADRAPRLDRAIERAARAEQLALL